MSWGSVAKLFSVFGEVRSVDYPNGIEAISPGFARDELPWEIEEGKRYPERVGSMHGPFNPAAIAAAPSCNSFRVGDAFIADPR